MITECDTVGGQVRRPTALSRFLKAMPPIRCFAIVGTVHVRGVDCVRRGKGVRGPFEVRTFSRIWVVSRIVRTWKWLRRSSGVSISSTAPSIACSRKTPLYLAGQVEEINETERKSENDEGDKAGGGGRGGGLEETEPTRGVGTAAGVGAGFVNERHYKYVGLEQHGSVHQNQKSARSSTP